MTVRILLFIFLLATTIGASQNAQAIEVSNEGQRKSPTPDDRIDCGRDVNPIYRRLFNPDLTALPMDIVKTYVDDAYNLLTDPKYRYVCDMPGREAIVLQQIEILHDLADENQMQRCDINKMASMKRLERVIANHNTLGPYIIHYNAIAFELCAQKLILKLSLSRQRMRDTNNRHRANHLSQLSKLVARRRQELIEGADYPIEEADDEDEVSLRNTSICMIRYMSETINLDIEKPISRPMLEQLDIIGKWEDDVFYPDCVQLGDSHDGDYAQYQFYIEHYRHRLRHLFWENENAADLLDQLRICHQLIHANKHIYLLGQYDIDEIVAILDDRDEGANSPDEIRNLLEIGLFATQSEVYLGYESDRDFVRECIDLLVLSQISVEKCNANYFGLVEHQIGSHEDHPNVMSYMRHYVHLQVVECLPGFQAALKDLTKGFSSEHVFDLLTLYNIFNDVTKQVEPSLRLYYESIPHTVIRLAAEKVFDFYGMNLSTLKESDLQKLAQTKARSTSLFDSCRLLINRLKAQVELYSLFMAVDPQIASVIGEESLAWMSQYNICKSIFDP